MARRARGKGLTDRSTGRKDRHDWGVELHKLSWSVFLFVVGKQRRYYNGENGKTDWERGRERK